MTSLARSVRYVAIASPRRRTYSAFGVLALMVAGHAVLETARDTLFLSELPPTRLPLLYLAVAGVTVLISRLRSERLRVRSQHRVLWMTLAGASAVTLGFWFLVGRGGTAPLYALYLWSALFVSLVLVQFWLHLDEHFTITQARRAYAFIGAGALTGAAIGALLARAAVALLAPRALLALSAALIALAGLAAYLLLPSRAPRGEGAAETDMAPSGGEPLLSLLHQPYFRHLGMLAALTAVVGTTVDFLFKSTVVAALPTRSLGAAFASAAFLQAALSLVAQLVLTGWLLRRVGVTRALLVLPLCLALGTVGLVVGGGLVAAFALKSLDAALRQSLQRTGMELLYLPVEDGLRRRVKPVLDVFGQRLGQALAGVGLLAADAAGATPRTLALAVLGLLGVWLAVTRLLHEGYLDLFRSALRRGRVRLSERMPDLDFSALEALLAALNSREDRTVLSALDLLEASGRTRVVPALILFHPSREVVLRAFELFQAQPRPDDLPVMERLLAHPDAEVRAAALRTVAARSSAEEALRTGLEDASPFVRATALVGTAVRTCPDEGQVTRYLARAGADDPGAAAALARAIQAQPSPLFSETLRALARHPNAEVQREAALALREQPDPTALPLLIAMLAAPRQRGAAREALVSQGEAAADALIAALDSQHFPVEVRRSVPSVLARFPPRPRIIQALSEQLEPAEDGLLRFRALRALGRLHTLDPSLTMDESTIARFLERTVTQALCFRHWRLSLAAEGVREPSEPSAGRSLLAGLLLEKERYAIERTFRALDLLRRDDDVWRIYLGFRDLDPKVRASSRELLEALVRPPLRGALLTLVDRSAAPEAAEQAAHYHQPRPLDGTSLLEAMLEATSGTLRALAAYHAAELGLQQLRPRLEALRTEGSSELREVVERALRMLDQPPRRNAHVR